MQRHDFVLLRPVSQSLTIDAKYEEDDMRRVYSGLVFWHGFFGVRRHGSMLE
jgi:hypothetical protein